MISGRVLKLVEFSKDLFIDVYDRRGNLVEGVAFKDDAGG